MSPSSHPTCLPVPEIRAETVIKFVKATRGVLDKPTLQALLDLVADKYGFDRILDLNLPDTFQIGPVEPDEVIRKFYRINACPSGTLLPHNQNSNAIQGFFWPMGMQPQDILWYARPYDMNNAVLIGPEEETFTGKAVVVIFKFPSNPIQINP